MGLDFSLRLLQSQINKIWQPSKYKQNIEVGNQPALILAGMCVLFLFSLFNQFRLLFPFGVYRSFPCPTF